MYFVGENKVFSKSRFVFGYCFINPNSGFRKDMRAPFFTALAIFIPSIFFLIFTAKVSFGFEMKCSFIGT